MTSYLSKLRAAAEVVQGLTILDSTLPAALPEHGNTFVIGGRNVGKTTLLCDLVRARWAGNMNTAVVVLSTTAATIQKFAIIKDANILVQRLPSWSVVDFEAVVKPLYVAHCALKSTDCSLVIVFDDVYGRKLSKSQVFNSIMLNGRHERISTLISTQYVMDIPPRTRNEVDVAVFMQTLGPQRVCYVDTRYALDKHTYSPDAAEGLPCVFI